MTKWLTDHFSLEELTATQHRGIDNTPDARAVVNLRRAADGMEAVRALLGNRVVTVSSGFRCEALNRAVGGAKDSAHLAGYAVDFNCYSFGSPLEVCRVIVESRIAFDQLIEEGTWVHLSFAPNMRGQVLTKSPGGGYRAGLKR